MKKSFLHCRSLLALVLLALLTALPVAAQESKKLTAIGSDSMGTLMRSWVEAFKEQQPAVNMQLVSRGSATAPAALIEGSADLGPMARPMKTAEIEKFTSKYGFEPTQIRTAISAIGVYVARSNPLDKITFEQLDAIYSSTRKRSEGEQTLETWKDLGLKGKFSGQAIIPIGLEDETQASSYFRQQVMLQGDYAGKVMTAADNRAVFQLLAANPNGIAFGELQPGASSPGSVDMSQFKMLKVSKEDGEPFVAADERHVKDGSYPLSRFLNIYIVRYPGEEIDPSLKQFLQFVLSPSGQHVALREGLVPLPSNAIAEELTKLN